MSLRFFRKKEDFTCENCGAFNKGDGYTNHCTECLWSKHVDENPGDRKSKCGGLMEPIAIEKKGDDFIVKHRCHRCLYENTNKLRTEDKFEKLI